MFVWEGQGGLIQCPTKTNRLTKIPCPQALHMRNDGVFVCVIYCSRGMTLGTHSSKYKKMEVSHQNPVSSLGNPQTKIPSMTNIVYMYISIHISIYIYICTHGSLELSWGGGTRAIPRLALPAEIIDFLWAATPGAFVGPCVSVKWADPQNYSSGFAFVSF